MKSIIYKLIEKGFTVRKSDESQYSATKRNSFPLLLKLDENNEPVFYVCSEFIYSDDIAIFLSENAKSIYGGDCNE